MSCLSLYKLFLDDQIAHLGAWSFQDFFHSDKLLGFLVKIWVFDWWKYDVLGFKVAFVFVFILLMNPELKDG